MKKLYSIICVSALTLLSINANATTHFVAVGVNQLGSPANTFTPSSFTAAPGDIVTFTLGSTVPHSATSTTIPNGAASFDSGVMTTQGQMFSYTIVNSGTYNYICSVHGASMSGSFSVSGSVGIAEPNVTLSTSVYPNPFVNNLTVNYSGINKMEVFNVVGELVKSIDLGGNQGSIEMNFEGSPAGIYFYRTYRDGIVAETKKIVKAK